MNLKKMRKWVGFLMLCAVMGMTHVPVQAAVSDEVTALKAESSLESETEKATEKKSSKTEETTTAKETTTTKAEETTTTKAEETTTTKAEETTTAKAEETTAAKAEETTAAKAEETTTSREKETTASGAKETTASKEKETTSAKAEETTASDGPVLSAGTLSLGVGMKEKLTVSGLPDGVKVDSWETTDDSLATVTSGGTVEACQPGTVKIHATLTDGMVLTCKVTIPNVSLNNTELSLKKDGTETLKVSGSEGKVTWSSSNTDKVTVNSSGKVTAKSYGSATVTAKIGSVELKCRVKVSDPEISNTSLRIMEGDEYTLSASQYSGSVKWSSSDKSVATVSGKGVVTAKKGGTATITMEVDGVKLTCTVTVVNEEEDAGDIFGTTVSQLSVGISSLRNLALGSSSRYRFMQGSCTDGTYGYFILSDNSGPYCALVKIRLSDWKVVGTKTKLKLYHGNDMAYRDGYLLVVNGDGNYQGVTYVSASTLEIEKTQELDDRLYALAYSEERDQYVTADGSCLYVRDSSWKTIRSFDNVEANNFTRQGIDCDSSYIYVIQSNISGRKNRILVYDWEGSFITQVSILGRLEGESLFHVGDRFIVSYNDATCGGGCIYTTAMKHCYLVQYSASGGNGISSFRMVETGSGFTAAACRFIRQGYSFAGWSASRSSDGKAAYRNRTTRIVKWFTPGEQPSGYELYVIPAGKRAVSLSSMDADCITLSAVWKSTVSSGDAD